MLQVLRLLFNIKRNGAAALVTTTSPHVGLVYTMQILVLLDITIHACILLFKAPLEIDCHNNPQKNYLSVHLMVQNLENVGT